MKKQHTVNFIRLYVLVILCLFMVSMMTGCASNPDKIVFQPPETKVVTVEKLVPVQCLSSSILPAYPKLLTADELKSLDNYSFVTMLYVERKMLIDYANILSAAIAPCM